MHNTNEDDDKNYENAFGYFLVSMNSKIRMIRTHFIGGFSSIEEINKHSACILAAITQNHQPSKWS